MDDFTLQNEPVKERRWQPPATEQRRQTVLFSGLDLLPGQNDLFATDGQAIESDPAPGNTAGA